jgi:hypothetical protein
MVDRERVQTGSGLPVRGARPVAKRRVEIPGQACGTCSWRIEDGRLGVEGGSPAPGALARPAPARLRPGAGSRPSSESQRITCSNKAGMSFRIKGHELAGPLRRWLERRKFRRGCCRRRSRPWHLQTRMPGGRARRSAPDWETPRRSVQATQMVRWERRT